MPMQEYDRVTIRQSHRLMLMMQNKIYTLQLYYIYYCTISIMTIIIRYRGMI